MQRIVTNFLPFFVLDKSTVFVQLSNGYLLFFSFVFVFS